MAAPAPSEALQPAPASRPLLVALPPPTPRTATRAALANATKALAALTAKRADARSAFEAASRHEAGSREALAVAQAAFDATKTEAANALATGIAGGGNRYRIVPLAEVRSDLNDAQDALDVSGMVLSMASASLAAAETELASAIEVRHAREAAYDVLRAEINGDALVARIETLQRDLFAASSLLSETVARGIVESSGRAMAALRLSHAPFGKWADDRPDIKSAPSLHHVVAELIRDPDAALPAFLKPEES